MLQRPDTMPSASSSDLPIDEPVSPLSVLVTTHGYDAGGFLSSTTDPTGLVTTYYNDYLGRPWKVVVNSTAGTTAAVNNQVTLYVYNGLNDRTSVTVYNVVPGSGNNPPQEMPSSQTQYIYQASTNTDGQTGLASDINSDDLLSMIKYPDGTTQKFFYDSLGELIDEKNRDNSVHAYQYDLMGRQTMDTVEKWASNVSTAITALGYTYTALGQLYQATSYSERDDHQPGPERLRRAGKSRAAIPGGQHRREHRLDAVSRVHIRHGLRVPRQLQPLDRHHLPRRHPGQLRLLESVGRRAGRLDQPNGVGVRGRPDAGDLRLPGALDRQFRHVAAAQHRRDHHA